jgi:4-amino-4-deoxy-L-arabinose transferase-like glycosyltransferase
VGRSAQLPAMWIMALAVAQIAYSAVTMTEIVFSMFAVLCIVAATAVARRDRPGWWRWAGVGVLIGFCFLIRNPAFVLGIVPVGLAYRSRRSWRDAAVAGAAVLVGAAVLLVPWAVRNGVQVGVWTPGGTNVAHLLCLGHRDGANGRFQQDLTETVECTTDSPFDNVALVPLYDGDAPAGFQPGEPDEAAWYRRQFPKAYAWAVAHPGREAELVAFKVGELMNGEAVGGAMDAVQGFGTRQVVPARTESLVRLLANVWHWAVLAFAVLAVAFLPRARAAWPLWLVPLVWTVTSVLGPETDERYFYPSQPFLVVLAAAMLTAVARSIAQGRTPTVDEGADDTVGHREAAG